ncbi:MAG: hypothetical protein ACJ74Z_09605 [Bryobacteraceae bacterium]
MKTLSLRFVSVFVLLVGPLQAQESGKDSLAPVTSLLNIKRIYIAPLIGGVGAASLRELIMASMDSSKLFVMTDNPDRADAILKGAADDQTFTDTFDVDEGLAARQSLGLGSSKARSATGGFGGVSVGDHESHHARERKHEAYATVRLCNRDGDVLWSTTQESLGGKFRGASADVAAKVAHQLTLDIDRARRASAAGVAPKP